MKGKYSEGQEITEKDREAHVKDSKAQQMTGIDMKTQERIGQKRTGMDRKTHKRTVKDGKG